MASVNVHSGPAAPARRSTSNDGYAATANSLRGAIVDDTASSLVGGVVRLLSANTCLLQMSALEEPTAGS